MKEKKVCSRQFNGINDANWFLFTYVCGIFHAYLPTICTEPFPKLLFSIWIMRSSLYAETSSRLYMQLKSTIKKWEQTDSEKKSAKNSKKVSVCSLEETISK